MTTEARFSARARSMRRAMRCWWPRWTPSNLPMVTAGSRPGAVGASSSRAGPLQDGDKVWRRRPGVAGALRGEEQAASVGGVQRLLRLGGDVGGSAFQDRLLVIDTAHERPSRLRRDLGGRGGPRRPRGPPDGGTP